MGNLNFNVEENESENDYTALPKGSYEAIITASTVKNTKGGTGQYLQVEFTITEESFEGRKAFANFNIKNDSEKAQRIGLGQLSALCKACGKTGIVDDSSELHGLPVIIMLDIEEYNHRQKNVVKGYSSKSIPFSNARALQNSVPSVKFADDDLPL